MRYKAAPFCVIMGFLVPINKVMRWIPSMVGVPKKRCVFYAFAISFNILYIRKKSDLMD